jgi:hypothetical protein
MSADGALSAATAELSSAATDLAALIDRITTTAESLERSGAEMAAHDLFEVERSLQAASRRMAQTMREMR